MVKSKSVFVCQNCGAKESKWVGKCSTCGEWNSFVEEVEVITKGNRTASGRPMLTNGWTRRTMS